MKSRICVLCAVIVLLGLIGSVQSWRRRVRFRIRSVRHVVSHVVEPIRDIRVSRVVHNIEREVSHVVSHVRRTVEKVKDVVENAGDSMRDIRDKIKKVAVCTRISRGRVSNRCHGSHTIHDGVSGSGNIEHTEHIPIEIAEPDVNYCRNITTRNAWGAASLTDRPPMTLPVKVVALYMGEEDCFTADCRSQASNLYTETENYNFLIDGGGSTYEGRGWHSRSDHHVRDEYKRTEYGVALIMTTSPHFDIAFDELLMCGLQLGYIDSTFDANTDIEFRF